ncbi:hypothetical protein [Rhizobium sp. S96]|uniref:hypothetical protein n=1 Tax=Rhizobium sp. S96 TaxID=3055140 RepID=UPI0025AA8141|nr:hypothetical protein [Rhizobium sp. S96]MDM9621112.1 hypothetical protein [Rhizobium sp. S96]
MQLEWVEVTNIAYIDEDKIFVGEIDVTWTDQTLPGTVGVAGYSVRVKTQVFGDTTLPFEEVEKKLKEAAIDLLPIAAEAIGTA